MPKDTPKITVLSTEWRKNMCERLGLVYQHSIIQPLNLVGERISDYRGYRKYSSRWQLFLQVLVQNTYREREQPHSVTGNYIKIHSKRRNDTTSVVFSSESYNSLRLFIGRETNFHGWSLGRRRRNYCRFSYSRGRYLYSYGRLHGGRIYCARHKVEFTQSLSEAQAAIYITNFGCHFQPVISMINSPTPTYGNITNHVYTIE